ncbi:MAG: PD-(D/E)XK nuclease family protein [Limnochordia bacterium]|nr:PD-(D/E)XK nuclease family protein [Limnochordia bacterium]
MGVRFIVGRAGTGKTHHCITSIAQKAKDNPTGPPIVLLVPDQATFQMEHRLLECQLPSFSRIHVFSFGRLANYVFSLEGGRIAPEVRDLGKQMLLRRLVDRRLPELMVFDRVARYPGFTKYLGVLFTELCNWSISLEDLKQVAGSGAYLDAKLHDIALLYHDYLEYLEQGYFDPDTALDLLADACDASFVQQAEFWIDGFSGFTPQEYKVLAGVMQHAAQVHIALCLDADLLERAPRPTNPFYPVWMTYQRCHRLAQQQGASITIGPLLSRPYRFRKEVLKHLEASFATTSIAPYRGKIDGLEIVAAADRRHEVEIVARRIVQLVQSGMRYHEIGVILRDFGPYGELIHDIFTDYGIPHFLDRRRRVTHHPLAELVHSVLQMAHGGIIQDALFRLLKTDLTPLETDRIDLLERYCLETQLSGRDWYQPWTDGVLEDIRERVIDLLEPFCQAVGQAGSVRQMTRILYDWLLQLKVPTRLVTWSEEAAAKGDLVNAKTHLGVWDVFASVLEQVVEVLGDESLELDQYLAVIESGLEGMQQGLIPLGLDQVLVGSVERSRQPELKAVFVLGLCEGEFPSCREPDSLINDDERRQLAAMGIELGYTLTDRLVLEQYLAYIAVSRASSLLHLSYCQNDENGRFLGPSRIVERICRVFPGLSLKEVVRPESGAFTGQGQFYIERLRESVNVKDVVLNLTGALATLQRAGWDIPSELLGVYQEIKRKYPEASEFVLSSLTYDLRPQRLNVDVTRNLFSRTSSVSQVETFAACPFRHFLQYGLQIRAVDRRQFTPVQRGILIHRALSAYGQKLNNMGLDWSDVSSEQSEQLIREIVEGLLQELAREVNMPAATLAYYGRSLQGTLTWAVSVLSLHDEQGQFKPVAYEQRFGYNQEWPGLQFDLAGDKIVVRGSIDRIDLACAQDQALVRIIDYKSSRQKLALEQVYHGLSLQLMVYMLVVLDQNPRLLPAGVLYFPITDRFVNSSGPMTQEEALAIRLKQVAMTGLLVKDVAVVSLMDPVEQGYSQLLSGVMVKKDGTLSDRGNLFEPEGFERLSKHVTAKLSSFIYQWLSGVVDVAPYRLKRETACKYCDYPSICAFEANVGGLAYRDLVSYSDQQVWELMQYEDTIALD